MPFSARNSSSESIHVSRPKVLPAIRAPSRLWYAFSLAEACVSTPSVAGVGVERTVRTSMALNLKRVGPDLEQISTEIRRDRGQEDQHRHGLAAPRPG